MATASLAASAPPVLRKERIDPLVAWLLCWVLLPNIGFWLLWLFGAPPRTAEIVGTGAIGLLVRHRGRRVQFAALVAAMLWSAISYVSAVFNLAPTEIVASLTFLFDLKPIGSVEYLFAALFAAALLICAWWALGMPNGFNSAAKFGLAFAAIAAAAGLDFAVSWQSRGSYKHWPEAGAPFSSAVTQSGLLRRADGSRHLILVIVEAMGQPLDPALRQQLFGRWSRRDITDRYTVRFGSTPYYGSTTSGEIRELCGRWGDYSGLIGAADANCLPARLRTRGYETTAMHSFVGSLFDRERWYPNIGFDHMVFRDTLAKAGATECPGVFPGVCDRDVPAIIARRLKQAQRPQFLYWLTVNSHLPVPAAAQLRTDDCLEHHPDFPMQNGSICRLATVIRAVDDSLARVISAPDFPESDILIVGDHMPPFFDHGSRSQFDPDHVPWILLTARDNN